MGRLSLSFPQRGGHLILRRTIFAAVLITLSSAGFCRAAEMLGVQIPETAEVSGKTLLLNGYGLRVATMLNVKVYVGALYLPKKTNDPNEILNSTGPIRLDLTYLRGFGQESVSKAWRFQLKESVAHPYPDLQKDAEKVISFFGPLEKGGLERMEVDGDEVKFYDQGVFKGSIRGENFRKAFLSMWVGPKPPTQDFKKGLLGQ